MLNNASNLNERERSEPCKQPRAHKQLPKPKALKNTNNMRKPQGGAYSIGCYPSITACSHCNC